MSYDIVTSGRLYDEKELRLQNVVKKGLTTRQVSKVLIQRNPVNDLTQPWIFLINNAERNSGNHPISGSGYERLRKNWKHAQVRQNSSVYATSQYVKDTGAIPEKTTYGDVSFCYFNQWEPRPRRL